MVLSKSFLLPSCSTTEEQVLTLSVRLVQIIQFKKWVYTNENFCNKTFLLHNNPVRHVEFCKHQIGGKAP